MDLKFKKGDNVVLVAFDDEINFTGVIIDTMSHGAPSYAVDIPEIECTVICSEDQLELIKERKC